MVVMSIALRTLAAALAVAAGATASAQIGPITPTALNEYLDRDEVQGPNVMLASAPIRPLAFDASGKLWAVNFPENTVEKFSGGNQNPVAVYRVPWGPVAVGHYVNLASQPEVLVVTRNTWALTRLDAATGAVLDVVPLDAEPSDLLVDQGANRAFVSCMGGDSVVQIDLSAYAHAIQRRYHFQTHPAFLLKSPLFLSSDGAGGAYVAPLHSGNNSTVRGADIPPSGNEVISLYDPVNAPSGLTFADHDLFRIEPSGTDPVTGAPGKVTPVARRTGTVLFGHAMHPHVTPQTLWQLNTDAVNTGATNQSEPAVRGRFAKNQLTILPMTAGGVAQADPATHYKGFDPGTAGYTTATTVAQPFAVAFHPDPAKAYAYVIGLGSDNVAMLDTSGNLVKEWNLLDGAIPRGVVVDPAGSAVAVYCWGLNEIRTFRWANNPVTPLVTYRLSHDLTPAVLKEGRAIFFDSSNSAFENLSCATCHIDGGSDFLAWNLSNAPKDDKGPMVTQTLIGLDRMAPFHWRGEREFEDFIGAVEGLLGKPTPMDAGDFDKMKAFLFALSSPANPFQHRNRILDPAVQFISNSPPGGNPVGPGDAVQGQDDWRTQLTFQGRFTCNRCHAQPTGTNNDIFNDFPPEIPLERSHLKVAPFHELWRKSQLGVDVLFVGINGLEAKHRRSFLGAGISHSGAVPDILNFASLAGAGTFLPNITAFLHQWDQGLGRAVHSAFHLNAATAGLAVAELQNYLFDQASNERNCDLVAFGTSIVGGNPVATRWFYDRTNTTGKPFRCDVASAVDRDVNDFIAAAAAENHVFLGLPVGTGEAFSIDYDRDGVLNGSDAEPWDVGPVLPVDMTPPQFTDGPHAPWVTTGTARVWFDTDEWTTAEIAYREVGSTAQPLIVQSPVLGRTHALMLPNLRTSTTVGSSAVPPEFGTEAVAYQVDVTIRDLAGYTALSSLTVGTDSQTLPVTNFAPATNENDRLLLHEHIIRNLTLTTPPFVPGSPLASAVSIDVGFNAGDQPAAEHRAVVGRFLKVPAGTHQAVPVPALDLSNVTGAVVADSVILSALSMNLGVPGPLFVTNALTSASGVVALAADVSNLAAGDELQFNVEAVVEIPDSLLSQFATNVAACSGGCASIALPVLSNRAFTQWNFPATKEARACVSKKL